MQTRDKENQVHQHYVNRIQDIFKEIGKLKPIAQTVIQIGKIMLRLQEFQKEVIALRVAAETMLCEVKANPNDLFLIENRADKIDALCQVQENHIFDASDRGELALPKTASFDSTLKEVRANLDRYLSEFDTARTDLKNAMYTKANNLYEIYQAQALEAVKLRKEAVKLNNEVMAGGKYNNEMASQLHQAAIARSKELTKDGADKFVEKLSPAEAQKLYNDIITPNQDKTEKKGETKKVVASQQVAISDHDAAEAMMKSLVGEVFSLSAIAAAAPNRSSNVTVLTKLQHKSETESKEGQQYSPPTPPGMVRTQTNTPEGHSPTRRSSGSSSDSSPPSSPGTTPMQPISLLVKGERKEGQPAPNSLPSFQASAHSRLQGTNLTNPQVAAANGTGTSQKVDNKVSRNFN